MQSERVSALDILKSYQICMEETYTIGRVCSNCEHKERISVSKREAAFELVNIDEVVGKSCKKCSGLTFSFFYSKVELDIELIKEWATNSDLRLMPQDEALRLADEKYLEHILTILDNVSIPDRKRNVLMQALCVMVFDNTVDDDPVEDNQHCDQKLKQRVIRELNKRTKELKQSGDWIADYLKDVVYPQLDLQ